MRPLCQKLVTFPLTSLSFGFGTENEKIFSIPFENNPDVHPDNESDGFGEWETKEYIRSPKMTTKYFKYF